MVSQKTGGCSKQFQKVAAIGKMSSSLILIRCRRQEMVAALQKLAADGRGWSQASKARCHWREVVVN